MTETASPIRIGVIGAGGIFKNRHFPHLRKIDGVELVAVSNRSEESAKRVAEQWGVERIESDWRAIVEADDIHAVMIGTWPYMHKQLSVAALEAGKHVFCQARMAMDLTEADMMVAASDTRPMQVAVVCPPPHRMPAEPYVQHLLRHGELGELREAHLHHTTAANLGKISWRERVEHSGEQALAAGIWAEALHAWLGEYQTLRATTAIPIPSKPDPEREDSSYQIAIPQVVLIHGTLRSGLPISERHSGVTPHEPKSELTVVGRDKSLRIRIVDNEMKVDLAEGDRGFRQVEPPPEQTNPWRVERDFVDAVRAAQRGEPWRNPASTTPDFHEARKYMLKMHAIHRSAESGAAFDLG